MSVTEAFVHVAAWFGAFEVTPFVACMLAIGVLVSTFFYRSEP